MNTNVASHRSAVLSGLYQSLLLPPERKCIRLLDIHAAGEDGTTIESEMRVADLECHPTFTAVSYVWGQMPSPPQNTTINCHGLTIPVTATCHSALLHLRKKLGNFTIWIDAVCINQQDEVEKSWQISLMGEIYSTAKEVYVWLGEGTEATERAMSYLGTSGFLKYAFTHDDPYGSTLSQPRPWAAALSALIAYCSPARHPFPFLHKDSPLSHQIAPLQLFRTASGSIYTSYYDLDELLTRDWTKRIWTYQEIMLAHNPVIVCGNAHLPWSRFALSIIFLDHIRPKRLANLTIPLDTTLKTWKKIILTRVRLADGESKTGNKYSEPDIKSTQRPTAKDMQMYQRFLYDTFSRCLMCCRIVVALAYGSVVNLTISIVITLVMPSRLILEETSRTGLFIYVSLSSALCIAIFLFYATMAYSYYYKTFFNMPLHTQWVRNTQEDTEDDFIDAIITRKATNPKDMAFGLYAVLQKKLKRPLPKPNYAASVVQIYRDLTVNLLYATNQLRFLIPAAGNALPGQPSWIPDWASELPLYWLQPFISNVSNDSSMDVATPTSTHTFSNELVKPDAQNADALTIWGHIFCKLDTCFELQSTKVYYDESEENIHLDNIAIIKRSYRTWHYTVERDFFTNRLNYPNLPVDINSNDLRNYFTFFWTSQKLSPHIILRILTGKRWLFYPLPFGLSLPLYLTVSSRQLLHIHISVCNAIANSGRKFFSAQYDSQQGMQNAIGVCGTGCDVGDQVVFVPGLPSLLVIRWNADSTRLVSPAVLFENVEKEMQRFVRERKKDAIVDVLEPITIH